MDFSLSVERDGEFHDLKASAKGDEGLAPEQNWGFREMQEATFHGPDNKGWRLLIDDAPLTLVDKDRPGVWIWHPGFYAGQVEATLQDETGTCRGRWHLDVSPDIAILNELRASFNFSMLSCVWYGPPFLGAYLCLRILLLRRLSPAIPMHGN